MQLKIHKEGNPGRPVISSVNYITTKIFQYVGHDLQPNVEELESFAKDLTDFMKTVFTTDKVPQERFLDTMDVCSLYISIPNNEGIKAVETTLKWKNLQTKVIINVSIKQFYIQLRKIGKHLHEYIWGNAHLSINQTKSAIISQINR